MEQKQQMHALRLGQRLAVAAAIGLTLLIVGMSGLGVAIWQSGVVPPDLDVSLGGLGIVAYITDPIECQPNSLCPGLTRYYRMFWVVRETAPDYVHDTWRRILSVPLQR